MRDGPLDSPGFGSPARELFRLPFEKKRFLLFTDLPISDTVKAFIRTAVPMEGV
jgi:hypothetical protein